MYCSPEMCDAPTNWRRNFSPEETRTANTAASMGYEVELRADQAQWEEFMDHFLSSLPQFNQTKARSR